MMKLSYYLPSGFDTIEITSSTRTGTLSPTCISLIDSTSKDFVVVRLEVTAGRALSVTAYLNASFRRYVILSRDRAKPTVQIKVRHPSPIVEDQATSLQLVADTLLEHATLMHPETAESLSE